MHGKGGRFLPAPTIVFLPGAGQAPDDLVLGHMVGGLNANRVKTRIVSLPYEQDRDALAKFLATHEGDIIIAGHSMGGANAMRAARQFPGRIKGAILRSTRAAGVGDQSIPTLLLRGTNDNGPGFDPREGGNNVTNVEVKGGNHSLRFRERMDQDKDGADRSEATRAMNVQVGEEIKTFPLASSAAQADPARHPGGRARRLFGASLVAALLLVVAAPPLAPALAKGSSSRSAGNTDQRRAARAAVDRRNREFGDGVAKLKGVQAMMLGGKKASATRVVTADNRSVILRAPSQMERSLRRDRVFQLLTTELGQPDMVPAAAGTVLGTAVGPFDAGMKVMAMEDVAPRFVGGEKAKSTWLDRVTGGAPRGRGGRRCPRPMRDRKLANLMVSRDGDVRPDRPRQRVRPRQLVPERLPLGVPPGQPAGLRLAAGAIHRPATRRAGAGRLPRRALDRQDHGELRRRAERGRGHAGPGPRDQGGRPHLGWRGVFRDDPPQAVARPAPLFFLENVR